MDDDVAAVGDDVAAYMDDDVAATWTMTWLLHGR
jgi:hypothetical protein